MDIRFGYVAMSVILEKASPSKNVTVKTYSRLAETNPRAALSKVCRTASENLANTLRLLRHNRASGVKIYRFSSKLIPLATHPLLSGWNYADEFKKELATIGSFVQDNEMRVSFHPDHYTLINSPREEVLLSSLKDLEHHCLLLETMGLGPASRLVTHVGGSYKDKEKSLKRFLDNWTRLPPRTASRLTLENDDKTFTAGEVLYLCRKLTLPMVLDIHHFRCNSGCDKLEEILPGFLTSWKDTSLPAKIHASSPRSPGDCRSHHDYVNPTDLYPFLKLAREFGQDLDVMVEAKQKDQAMFRLVKDLAACPMIRQTGPASLSFA